MTPTDKLVELPDDSEALQAIVRALLLERDREKQRALEQQRRPDDADRATPLKSYCTGLLLPGERKSVEPMAARLYPDNVRQAHQSMHHIVADAAWSDEDMLEAVRAYVLPQMEQKGSVVAWVVDDTGFVKKGTHSVGVTRQYCGQVGKQENCRVAVSLSVSTEHVSLPIAWRLYLPEVWAMDGKRRKKAGIPAEIRFQTKPAIALQQIRTALKREIPAGVVLADAAYGTDTKFREELSDLGLLYVVGIMSSVTVWKPGQGPLPAATWKGQGRPTKYLRRNRRHATLRQIIARVLLRQLSSCPFCGAPHLQHSSTMGFVLKILYKAGE